MSTPQELRALTAEDASKLLKEKYPTELGTPDNMRDSLVIHLFARIEVLETELAKSASVMKGLLKLIGVAKGSQPQAQAAAAPTAPPAPEAPVETAPGTEGMSEEEEILHAARNPNTSSGPARNAQPIPSVPNAPGAQIVSPPAPMPTAAPTNGAKA